jgi:UDP-N-acetylmuramoyl-tripeptide--D-alanyl-D-alanine ligase
MIRAKCIPNLKSVVSIVGDINEDWIEASTDTRSYVSGAFIAITGEKFNAVKYLEQVITKGCKLICFQESTENNELIAKLNTKNITLVKVKDTIAFMQELASEQIKLFKQEGNITIGISGSNGKTTHKEMIHHMINVIEPGKVIKTEKNNNNHIGVPLTVFQITPKTKYAVIEFGSNHPGEMKTVCDIVDPQYGITTNIGFTHMEFFETLDNVFKEEAYLYQSVLKNREYKFLINEDDEYLTKLENTENTIRYGKTSSTNKVIINHHSVQVADINLSNEQLIGEHNFFNLAGSFLLLKEVFPNKEDELVRAASSFKSSMNRSEWVDYQDKKVFLDAYNANPSSMKMSVDGYLHYCKEHNWDKFFLVIGDMYELGSKSDEYHVEVAKHLESLDIPLVVFVGKYKSIYESAYSKNSVSFETTKEFKESSFSKLLDENQSCFIKGSRSLQLESLVDITM